MSRGGVPYKQSKRQKRKISHCDREQFVRKSSDVLDLERDRIIKEFVLE